MTPISKYGKTELDKRRQSKTLVTSTQNFAIECMYICEKI